MCGLFTKIQLALVVKIMTPTLDIFSDFYPGCFGPSLSFAKDFWTLNMIYD